MANIERRQIGINQRIRTSINENRAKASMVLALTGLGALAAGCVSEDDVRQAVKEGVREGILSTATLPETTVTTLGATPESTTVTTVTEQSETLSVIRIESAEAAAQRFGADNWSKNPSNWEINEWGGAHLKENPNDLISQVKTAGAVLEGWIKPKERNSKFDAITVVAHPSVNEVEVQGATLWDFGSNNDAGFAQVLGQVRAKEAVEQPGVVVLPLCDKLGENKDLGLSVIRIESAKEAAQRFGADNWSKNPSNWEINEWGGAHLKENPNDLISQINLDGAVAEGWIKPENRASSYDAITVVAHGNVQTIEVQGATLWDFGSNVDQGFMQVLGQVRAKEAVEQPGVVVLPAHDCPVGQSN